MKTSQYNQSMLNFGLFFFFVQMSWIFACALQFNRKSQPCIFSPGVRFVFQLKRMQKKLGSAFYSLLLNDKQKKSFVFPNNEITEAVIFWAIGDHTQKFSSFGREKKTDQNSTENGYAVTSSNAMSFIPQFYDTFGN